MSALKLLKSFDEDDFTDGLNHTLLREISILKMFRGHPHIVQLQDLFYYKQKKGFILCLEYCEKGDLLGHVAKMKSMGQRVNFNLVRKILR